MGNSSQFHDDIQLNILPLAHELGLKETFAKAFCLPNFIAID